MRTDHGGDHVHSYFYPFLSGYGVSYKNDTRPRSYCHVAIHLTNRVRVPYCKLRTEFFPHRFIAIVPLFLYLHLFVLIFDQLKTGRRPTLFSGEPLLIGYLYQTASCLVPESGRLIEGRLYLYCVSDGFENDFYSRGTASNF